MKSFFEMCCHPFRKGVSISAGESEPAIQKRVSGTDRRKEANQMSMKKALDMMDLEQIAGGAEDPILQMTVTWQDANGNTYSTSYPS